MKPLTDWLVASTPLGALPYPLVAFFAMAVLAVVLLLAFVAPLAGALSWAERRIAGRIQVRLGPNRVGPAGFLQWVADALKLLLKEDIIPTNVDRPLFLLAPYLCFLGMFGTVVVLPFTGLLLVTDLNVGVLYLVAIGSLVTVGIIMAGWASNNKYSLLGAMRSAAQIVSYEIPGALALGTAVLAAGTLSTNGIVRAQEGGLGLFNWLVFQNPFTFVAFFLYFTSALAEINRVPFDIPEAESELVAGYNTEYSGFRFALFYLAEWANMFIISAIAVTVFLGGWQSPVALRIGPVDLAQLGVFFLKSFALVFVVIWIRWSLPRLRVDQLMDVCWKYLVPIAFVTFIGTAAWVWMTGGRSIFDLLSGRG
jgi:NADH-quinone oxidoreductase subunit H